MLCNTVQWKCCSNIALHHILTAADLLVIAFRFFIRESKMLEIFKTCCNLYFLRWIKIVIIFSNHSKKWESSCMCDLLSAISCVSAKLPYVVSNSSRCSKHFAHVPNWFDLKFIGRNKNVVFVVDVAGIILLFYIFSEGCHQNWFSEKTWAFGPTSRPTHNIFNVHIWYGESSIWLGECPISCNHALIWRILYQRKRKCHQFKKMYHLQHPYLIWRIIYLTTTDPVDHFKPNFSFLFYCLGKFYSVIWYPPTKSDTAQHGLRQPWLRKPWGGGCCQEWWWC